MRVVDLADLGASDRAALTTLLGRAAAASDHPALPEPQLLALTHPSGPPHAGRLVLAGAGAAAREALTGCAVLSPAADGSTVLHVVVDPSAAGAPGLGCRARPTRPAGDTARIPRSTSG